MHRPRRLALLFSIVAIAPVPVRAADPPQKDDDAGFMRVTRDERGSPQTLDTAVVSYSNGKEGDERVAVDLVAAIHIGDRAYYEALNKRFEAYDAVLYELVAPEGATPDDRPADGDPHPIAVMQDGLKSLLDLEHQLTVVDYRKPNFVHADMSPEDFERAMKDRGESFVTMFLRLAFEGMRRPPQAGAGEADDLKLLLALLSPNRPMALKRVMAGQLAQFGDLASALDGPGGSAIVSDRNQKALEVLRAALEDGKKRVCIFYGAAHMPDFEKRLLADFGLKQAGREWIVAWDMKPNPQSNEFLERLRKNREARDKARQNP